MEDDNIPELTKTELEKAIKHYIKQGSPEDAKKYIETLGPTIKDFNVEDELKKIDELIKKEIKEEK